MNKIDKELIEKLTDLYGLEIETYVNKLFIVIFLRKSRVYRFYRLISNKQRG